MEGAIPGKSLRQTTSIDEHNKRKKKYEENRPERKFNKSWKDGRQWLQYDVMQNVMTCKICIEHYGKNPNTISNLKVQNTFITGCQNFRLSAVVDHEKCKSHVIVSDILTAKSATANEIRQSTAGKTLRKLKEADRARVSVLFRNAQAVIKNNKSLRDYSWLCQLDITKGIDIGETYLNSKAAMKFVYAIAESERKKTITMLDSGIFSVMMDGSTDISGDEQEAVYIRFPKQGRVVEKFLGIGTPSSTTAKHLQEFIVKMLDSYNIDKCT